MYRAFCALLFSLIISQPLHAQIFPTEGSSVNYILVGFSFPSVRHANEYRLEIANGDRNTEESFKQNIIRSVSCKENKVIAEVTSFGSKYTWRVVSKTGNTTETGSMHHFSTMPVEDADTSKMKMQVLKSAEKYRDAFILSDFNRAMYDMNGRLVWFLPQTDESRFDIRQVRDLKITSYGTITFIYGNHDAYEVDYNGKVLWKAPEKGINIGDSTGRFNHELTRLSNGNYMVLGSEFIWSDPNFIPPKPGEPPPRRKPGEPMSHVPHRIVSGTIAEYDKKGNVIWSWKCSSYFPNSDLKDFPNHLLRPMDDIHQNSFYFDEIHKVIYLSYKNIHRIIKLKYPEGTVLTTYGEVFTPGQMVAKGNDLFCFQHSVKMSQDGYLYLFNNNSCNPDNAPQILMLKELHSPKDSLAVVWKYEFPVEPFKEQWLSRAHSNISADETVGGNVVELPDKSMFATLCVPYNDMFIISRDNKVLWHARNEAWSIDDKKWKEASMYRGSIIPDRKDLENIIWNSEPKN